MKKNHIKTNPDKNENVPLKNNSFKIFYLMISIIVLIFIGIFLGYYIFSWLNEKNYQVLKNENIKIIKDEIDNEFQNNFSNQLKIINSIEKKVKELSERFKDIDGQLNSLKEFSFGSEQKEETLFNELSLINLKINEFNKELEQFRELNQQTISNTLKLDIKKPTNKSGDLFNRDQPFVLLYEMLLNDKQWDNQLYDLIQKSEVDFLKNFSKENDVLSKFSNSPFTNKQIYKEFEMILPEILIELPLKNDTWREKVYNWLVKTTQLRPADGSEGSLPNDKVAQIEKAIKENNLKIALDIFNTLPIKMQKPAKNWLQKLSLKIDVEKSMEKLIQEKRKLSQ